MAVTLRDIAKHLGLSHATVSFVLNGRTDMGITEATKLRVMAAAQELGYKPNRAARALTTGRTEMVAVCIPSTGDSYYASILNSIQNAMADSPYEVVVWQAASDLTRKPLRDLNVDGYIAIDLGIPDDEFRPTDSKRRAGVNIGLVARPGWDNVIIDVKDAAREAFQHLINVGCRRIAYLRASSAGVPTDALYKTFANLKETPGILTDEIQCNGVDREHAMEAVRDYVAKWGPPEGIVCANDSLAIAAKRALSELGVRTPADVAIIGSGGIEEAEYAWPPISTIRHPIAEIGQTAWSFLVHRLEWPVDQPGEEVFKARFVPRESSLGFRHPR